MGDRMETLTTVRRQLSTHDCPECQGLAYCAMEDGKSGNLCWCMQVKAPALPAADRCLCKGCLTKDRGQGSD